MQNKYIFFFLIFLFLSPAIISAEDKNKEVVQIVANSIEQNGTTINANGDVLIFSPNHYITTDKAIYDRNKSTVELFGNIHIVKANESTTIGKYAFLDLSNDVTKLTPILLIDKKSQVWINATKIAQTQDLKEIENATLSSCDCDDPTWSIGFSSGDFNTSKEWINMYNNTVYIKSIPAWYFLVPAIPFVNAPTLVMTALALKTPYFGFPTSKKRRSGLLIPKVGYGENEGWLYMQPIYFAPNESYDFTYIPQYRSKRGYGQELELRLVDSPYSRFNFNIGMFHENDTYFKEYEIKNKVHRGWRAEYKRDNLFTSADNSTDGLYVKVHDMNDVEYINTRYAYNDNGSTAIDKLLKSEATYYFNDQYSHFNTGINYYKDISKTDIENKETLQLLPSSEIHLYSHELMDTNILASLNLKQKRYDRESGIGANNLEIMAPIRYSRYLLNNYLLFGIDKTYSFNQIDYTNNIDNKYNNGTLLKDTSSFYLDMDLIKGYDSFIHNINFNARFSKIEYLKDDGDLFGYNNTDSNISSFPFTKEKDNVNLLFYQSFSNTLGEQILVHKMRQNILFDDNGTSSLSNLENDIVLYLPYSSISNKLKYNHDDNLVTSSLTSLRTSFNKHFFNFDYSYTVDLNSSTNSYKNSQSHESIVASMGTKVLKYYTVTYKEQYNITDDISTIKEYGLLIDKKCWALDLKFADNLVATSSTANVDETIRQKIIYATISLKPIGAIKQNYTIKEDR